MLFTRVLAAMVFGPAIFALVYFGGLSLAVACFVLASLMLWEYFRMVLPKPYVRLRIVGIVVGQVIAAHLLGFLPALGPGLLLPAGVLLLMVAALLHPKPIEGAAARMAYLVFGSLYCGGLIPYLFLLRDVPTTGLAYAMLALFCTWAADSGAYFAGKAFGKHKLYAAVSPGKTVEGLIGGLVASIAVAFLIARLFSAQLSGMHVFALGVLGGSVGVLGDLSESMLKRSTGVKDSSNLIPGHGGVLDRFDAVMFVAPVFYIYLSVAT